MIYVETCVAKDNINPNPRYQKPFTYILYNVPIGCGISGANGYPKINATCQDKTMEVEMHTTPSILHELKSRLMHLEGEDRGRRFVSSH
jgi:hypothetical protein